jgi:hypothetical protein
LGAAQGEVPPAAAPDLAILLAQPPQRGQHQRQGMIGDRLVVDAGGHGDHHTGGGGRLQIDRVQADPGAGDHPQLRPAGEHPGVEGIGVGDGGHRARAERHQLIRGAVGVPGMDGELQLRRA